MAWTKSRIEALETPGIRQLRINAESRGNLDIVALCDEVLATRPKPAQGKGSKRQRNLNGRPLVSRSKAFEMRGVKLRNPRWSWGGVRAIDGAVVFTVWANSIEAHGGERRYLLWGPNRGGIRPWSDSPGGRERLSHCELALARDEAEGVLIYGEQRGSDLPGNEASKVTGADPTSVLRFRVLRDGDEYWAVWPHTAGEGS